MQDENAVLVRTITIAVLRNFTVLWISMDRECADNDLRGRHGVHSRYSVTACFPYRFFTSTVCRGSVKVQEQTLLRI